MHAIVQTTYGDPTVLSLGEVPSPAVGDDQILVQVHASAVTQGDRRLRAGDFPALSWLPGRLMVGLTGPRQPVPGTIYAGRVLATGKNARRFSVGDDVFGIAMRGAYAEQLAVSEQSPVARMPAGWTYEAAAALPYGAGTALHFLRELGGLTAGQRVCVLGASGGVGYLAVQLARHLGAQVTGVASARNHAFVAAQGANTLIDYATQDFREAGPYDLILDTLGTSGFERCRGALSPQGRYLTLLTGVRTLLQMLRTKILGGQRALTGVAMGGPQAMEEVAALASQGAFRPVIARTFPLERTADAHAFVASGVAQGAVVVTVSGSRGGLSAVA